MPDTIAVRLPNWLGDTVMAVPALASLRAAFPAARVLAAGPWATMLAGQGLADAFLTYPRAWPGRLRATDTVREFRADLAVVLPSSFESALAARYWRATRRVGFATGGRAWLLTDPVARPSARCHQVDEYLAVVERLGVAVLTREPALRPPETESDERREARRLLEEAGAAPRGRGLLVGMHLGAAYGSSKLWPVSRVAELVREVVRDGGTVVLLGPPESRDLAREVREAAPTPDLVGLDTPRLLPALLTEVDVLVGGDTGVSHLAAALGTPIVALFGPTDPALTAPRGRSAVVRHPVPCSPCFYRRCPIDHPCMEGIAAREVWRRARALVGAGARA